MRCEEERSREDREAGRQRQTADSRHSTDDRSEHRIRQTEGVMIGTKRTVNVEKDEEMEQRNGRPRTPAQRARNSPSRAQRA